MMQTFVSDLGTVRGCCVHIPPFDATTLAIGIAAATTMFTILNE